MFRATGRYIGHVKAVLETRQIMQLSAHQGASCVRPADPHELGRSSVIRVLDINVKFLR